MSDVLSEKQRSYCMSKIKGRDTKPELIIRKLLWSKGYRYRKNNKLPGKPDLVFTSAQVAVFIDGCFWHRCPIHYVAPKTRAMFWEAKIQGNVDRDRRNNYALKDMGWKVIRFWEHQIYDDVESCAKIVMEALKKSEA